VSANTFLFLFTIGPVQSFIAQARKTRDLYASSAILGELIQVAMTKVKDLPGEIIVPNYELEAKPNRFLAKISHDDIQKFGEEIEAATKARWVEISLESFTKAGVCNLPQANGFDEETMRKINCTKLSHICPVETKNQIENFLEVYWVAIPYDEHNDNYHKKHDELQKLLVAIKNTRQFTQIKEPAGRKCSLDGERNALFYHPIFDKKSKADIPDIRKEMTRKFIQPGAQYLYNRELRVGEALSAVSLVKRFYAKKEKFPSTPRIALFNVIGKIEKSDEGKNFRDLFETSFDKLDEQLYYEENLNEVYFRKNNYKHLLPKLSEIKFRQSIIQNTFGKQMTKYYAILVFDGDNMGKIWSGNNLQDGKDLLSFQKQLAECLGKFAEETQKFLKPPYGKTVYSGGDDFLGFVNLNDLFEVMKKLREAYKSLVEDPIKTKFKESFSGSLTFTAGVAIAHYKEPLSVVLGDARAAEKAAKETFKDDDKNAFALSVLKHSGEARRCLFKWKHDEVYLTEKLDHVVEKLKDKENGFSNTFIKNIDREFRPLMDQDKKYTGDGIEDNMVETELGRLLTRSAMSPNKELREKAVTELNPDIMTLYRDSDMTDIENFFSTLHICDFIKRETAE